MALATQCPHCGTMFRVASDQLKLRGGIVRCGACQEIFDGSAVLVDLDRMPGRVPAPPSPAPDAAQTTPVPAETAAAVPAAAAAPDPMPFTLVETDDAAPASPSAAPDGGEETPVYTLDFDHTFDPFGILPKVDTLEPEAAPAPVAQVLVADAGAGHAQEAEPVAQTDLAAVQAPEVAPVMAQVPDDAATDAVTPSVPEAVTDTAPLPVAQAETKPAAALVEAAPADAATQPAADGAAPAAAPTVPDAEMPAPAAPEPGEEPVADPVADAIADPAVEPVAEPTVEPVAEPASPTAIAAPPVVSPAPGSDGRIEPAFDLPVDEELVAAALPADGAASPGLHGTDDTALLLMREAVASTVTPAPVPSAPPVVRTPAARRADKAAARRSKLTPTRIEAQPKLRAADIDEPEFVRRGRQQEQHGRTRRIALLAGSAVLALLLLGQGVFTFRHALAAHFPATKPALVSGCALFGCRVELPAQVESLSIETGELTTLGGSAYSYTTELRNNGSTAQAWPSLELALTDANDKPLLRRVFAPRDYLGADTPQVNGIAPHTEQAIKLHFRVDNLKPSGYHIAVFYP